MNENRLALIIIMVEVFLWGAAFGHVLTILWPAFKELRKK